MDLCRVAMQASTAERMHTRMAARPGGPPSCAGAERTSVQCCRSGFVCRVGSSSGANRWQWEYMHIYCRASVRHMGARQFGAPLQVSTTLQMPVGSQLSRFDFQEARQAASHSSAL